MRLLFLSIIAVTALATAACTHYESRLVQGSGGEVPAERADITQLSVLPVTLPDEILGDGSPQQKDAMRERWLREGSRLFADGVVDATDSATLATPAMLAPSVGYSATVVLTYVDVGDSELPLENVVVPDKELRTHVHATVVITDCATGRQVAELMFEAGSAYGIENPVENDIFNIGRELGEWLSSRE